MVVSSTAQKELKKEEENIRCVRALLFRIDVTTSINSELSEEHLPSVSYVVLFLIVYIPVGQIDTQKIRRETRVYLPGQTA